MGKNNDNLHTAKVNKNDEFYTRYEDIEAEVMKYRKQFIYFNKINICAYCIYYDVMLKL